jgi:putative endonuclease
MCFSFEDEVVMAEEGQRLGKWGEELAVHYLEEKGYEILDRNVRYRFGEIDIVAQGPERGSEMTVFIEVKTRSSTLYGHPEQAVDDKKKEHLLSAASAYIQEHPQRGDHWQVDVIAVERYSSGQKPQIHHFKNVFS